MSLAVFNALTSATGITAYFYALDALPLFTAVVIYVPFWPGRFIRPEVQQADSDTLESAEKKQVS